MFIPIGKDETITIEPLGALWVCIEESWHQSIQLTLLVNRVCKIQAYRVNRTCAAGAMPMGAPGFIDQTQKATPDKTSSHTRMARVGFTNDIRGEGADGGDGDLVSFLSREPGHNAGKNWRFRRRLAL